MNLGFQGQDWRLGASNPDVQSQELVHPTEVKSPGLVRNRSGIIFHYTSIPQLPSYMTKIQLMSKITPLRQKTQNNKVLGNLWLRACSLGGLQSWGLQSLSYRFWTTGSAHWLGAYRLGAYSWGPTVGGLQSGGLQSGGLQSRTTRFGFGHVHISLRKNI